MKLVSYTNETDKFAHIGGKTIPPGETRDVDETLVPGYTAPGADPKKDEAPGNPLLELLLKSIADIQHELNGQTDEQLVELAVLEADGKNRKGLLEAITVEQLARAPG